ncbi:MAG: thioredoxin family protein [Gammaproteobacteria bacterium]|nr:thioredoxin family protein [Gammaproteobacteria bacterium]
MNIQLVLARNTPHGQHTEKIWQTVCTKNSLELQVHDIETQQAQTLIEQINIKTFPALIVDKKIIAVGNPDHKTAERIFQSLISSHSHN